MKKKFLIFMSIIILFDTVNATESVMTVRKDAKNFTVELDKMNVLYMGVENPISIGYLGSAKVLLKITNGTVTPSNEKGKYIVLVYRGNEAIMGLYKIRGSKEILVGEKKFRVKRLPQPIAIVAGLKEGEIKKSALVAYPFVLAKYENFDFDLKLNVYSFTITICVAGEYKSTPFVGNSFSIIQISMIEKLKNNSRLIIEDIKCKLPDGTTRTLNPITLRVQT